jgi:Transcriptional regulator
MSGEPRPEETPLPRPPWERARRSAAPPRVPLTRRRIVDAAFTVLDREGFDGLSMRRVATELGVAVSALYAHVRDKDELLELMYNRLFDDMVIPDPDPDRWQEQIKEFARDQRNRLLRHRDMARISMAHVPFTRELLPYAERMFALFRAAGLPDHVVAVAGDMLATFIDGFAYEAAMWEERGRAADTESWEIMRTELEEYFAALPPDRFPSLVALASTLFSESQEQRFEGAIDIIVRGLASYLERPPEDPSVAG